MIDPALIPDGWGWALYHLDPAGPATVELYPNEGGSIEFQGPSPLEAWAAVLGFIGVPIAETLFPDHQLSDQAGREERDGGLLSGPAGQGEPGQATPDLAPAPPGLDPFS